MRATCYDSQRPEYTAGYSDGFMDGWLPWPKRLGLHFGPASATSPSVCAGRADGMSKTIQGFHRAGVAPGWERAPDDAGTTQYLPAVQPQRRQPPMLGEVLPPATDGTGRCAAPCLAAADGGAPERMSADDRAPRGRAAGDAGAVVGGAAGGGRAIIAFGVAGTVPAVLTFLLLMATVGGSLYLWESRTEYAQPRRDRAAAHCGVRRSGKWRIDGGWSSAAHGAGGLYQSVQGEQP